MIKLIWKKRSMLKPIKNTEQYEDYLERAYQLMQLELEPNSEKSDESRQES
jgi:HTH-type transcriptional regulator/antitoxin HigA